MSAFPTSPALDVNIEAIMLTLFDAMEEDSLSSNPDDWRLGPNEYYDFLESAGVGHRKLKRYVRERRVGEVVSLTKAGLELAQSLRDAKRLGGGE